MDSMLASMLSSENMFNGQEKRIKELVQACQDSEQFMEECKKYFTITNPDTFKRVYWKDKFDSNKEEN